MYDIKKMIEAFKGYALKFGASHWWLIFLISIPNLGFRFQFWNIKTNNFIKGKCV